MLEFITEMKLSRFRDLLVVLIIVEFMFMFLINHLLVLCILDCVFAYSPTQPS